jgi:hypothetical protein
VVLTHTVHVRPLRGACMLPYPWQHTQGNRGIPRHQICMGDIFTLESPTLPNYPMLPHTKHKNTSYTSCINARNRQTRTKIRTRRYWFVVWVRNRNPVTDIASSYPGGQRPQSLPECSNIWSVHPMASGGFMAKLTPTAPTLLSIFSASCACLAPHDKESVATPLQVSETAVENRRNRGVCGSTLGTPPPKE